MTTPDAAAAELLHSLGYLYMRNGQESRALIFLLIAYRIEPDHPGVLRTLAAAFVANGAGERALVAIDRLAVLEGGMAPAAMLLRARALFVAGRPVEARGCFRDYVELRRLP